MNTASSTRAETLQFNSPLGGARLDKYLAQVLPRLSRASLQKLIEQGYTNMGRELVWEIQYTDESGDDGCES